MMNQFFTLSITLFCICFHSFGQNKTDENGNRQGYWVITGKMHPDKGFPENGVIEEGTYVDNRREGEWIKYYNDGKTFQLKCTYKNNRPSGKYIMYYKSGEVKETGTFATRKNIDTLRRYYESGCLQMVRSFDEDGQEHGTAIFYYDGCDSTGHGQVQLTYEKEHGVSIDTLSRYYIEGYQKEMVVYDNQGKIIDTKKFERSTGPTPEPEPTNENQSREVNGIVRRD